MTGLAVVVLLTVLVTAAVVIGICAFRSPVQPGDSSRLDDMSRPTDGGRSE